MKPKDTEKYSWNDISLFNDLWNTSVEIYPELNTIKQNLEDRYNKNFFMSGSGSALFSLFEENEEIEEIDSEEFNLKYFSITKKIDCSFSQNDDQNIFAKQLGDGVIGNTMGFGPIVEGSSPSPPAINIEMNVSGVILAAGKGTRMKSNIPKVLHPVSGKKLVLYALEVIEDINTKYIVVGHEAEKVIEAVPDSLNVVIQEEQKGTCLLYTSPSPRDEL